MELYTDILEIRNNSIAHSGYYSNGLVLYFDPTTNYPIELKYSNSKKLNNKLVEYPKIIEIINYVSDEVRIIQQKLYNKLVEELKSKGHHHYYHISKTIDKSTIIRTILVNGDLIAQTVLDKKTP